MDTLAVPTQEVWNTLLERDFPQVATLCRKPDERLISSSWISIFQPLQNPKVLVNASDKKHYIPGQTFDDVVQQLRVSSQEWKSKEGFFVTARDKLLKVMDKLRHFQTLLNIFPNQSQYASPFYAAMKVLLMVLIPYSCRSKLLKSFQDGGFTEDMKSTLDVIKRIATEIQKLAESVHQAETRSIHGTVELTQLQLEQEIEQSRAHRTEVVKCFDELRISFEELRMQNTALYFRLQVAMRVIARNTNPNELAQNTLQITAAGEDTGTSSTSESEDPPLQAPMPVRDLQKYNVSNVAVLFRRSCGLENYHATKDLNTVQRQQVEGGGCRPTDRILSWMTAKHSELLWIQGKPTSERIPPISRYAAEIITSAKYGNVPVIYYFCGLHLRDSEHKVCTLVNSLSLQLLEMHSGELETEIDLTKQRFTKARKSFKSAWDLFEGLLRLLPTISVVIDCMEQYDDDQFAIRGEP
ncbi:hypothetical protein BDD12DRAFT_984597 [Trichophaea hybrida]|nr:hypothetical protein BDD12DRAFT_984597 [Trichophaea hybrida]